MLKYLIGDSAAIVGNDDLFKESPEYLPGTISCFARIKDTWLFQLGHKVTGFVNCDPSFTEQPKVVNGASDLLVQVFGESGKHARAAVGVSSLPLDSAVEVEFIAEI